MDTLKKSDRNKSSLAIKILAEAKWWERWIKEEKVRDYEKNRN